MIQIWDSKIYIKLISTFFIGQKGDEMKDKGYYDEKPWIKSTYEDVYKESLEPYPEIPVF